MAHIFQPAKGSKEQQRTSKGCMIYSFKVIFGVGNPRYGGNSTLKAGQGKCFEGEIQPW